jgi:hypothetical protein
LILALLLLAGAPPPPASQDVRQKLNRIADRCHLSRTVFTIPADGSIRFRPPVSARYERVDCALVALKRQGLVDQLPIAFVGSESSGPETKR